MNTRNKALIITGAVLLAVALVVFLVGGYLAGWDFAAYFRSQNFVWLCVVVGVYLVVVSIVLIHDRIGRL